MVVTGEAGLDLNSRSTSSPTIRFGRIAEEKILDRRRRVVSFAPGASSPSGLE